MARRFNVTGSCDSQLHYMVDITERLRKIKCLIDNGDYFTINRARQYGKTTTLQALAEYLKKDYIVISLDFQMLGNEEFENGRVFSKAFVRYFLRTIRNKKYPVDGLENKVLEKLEKASQGESDFFIGRLFEFLSDLCGTAQKPIVLIIDEVDSATNNQVFLDFLAQLRAYYLKRDSLPTFRSVILAGVYDVKNIRRKIRSDEEHKVNSPWNIATDFRIDMSFSPDDIAGMLKEYEADHHTGMEIGAMAKEIYEYTSGYPFLVSKICKLLDERVAGSGDFPDESSAWTKEGIYAAVNILTSEKNTLFESLTGKMMDYPELKTILSGILFGGKDFPYVATNYVIEIATMLGFVRNDHNVVRVSNRIFETVLYNHLLSEEVINSKIYDAALVNKYRFVEGRRLNMKRVLEGFVTSFREVTQDKDRRFLEEEGRKYFMLYLKPIINGTGHCYVEARTRDMKRTDLVVDYLGEQFVVELKIWNGPKYHSDGEKQIAEYLDFYNLKKGYMITFNFNRTKETGVREIRFGEKVLVEAVV